jgi:ribonucleoside-diphosphate reductase alpha chain
MNFNVTKRDGSREPLNHDRINVVIQQCCHGLPGAHWSEIAMAAQIDWFDGIGTDQIDHSVVLAAKSLGERHPDYLYAAARLHLRTLYHAVFGPDRVRRQSTDSLYREGFKGYILRGIAEGQLDPRLATTFSLPWLANFLDSNADRLFRIMGTTILADRYLVRDRQRQIIELPQWMWMRVAMGLALNEAEPTKRAREFYDAMSSLRYVPSTPTLFNAGTIHPQLSSCYLSTVEDSLEGIIKAWADNARLSKWAGGVGNDWTPIRAQGTPIRGTNGVSHGVVPWLNVDNALAVAVNQGGKRKGAHCAYLETWHLDIEEFLELRKGTGDDRRRTHDINTANWIPDLFMQRVLEDGEWTLFSPSDVPELHDLYGRAFREAYERREQQARAGEIRAKVVKAKALWKRMLTMLFETGHPWVTFKDPCNLRSPQQHVGVVHSSNLCTEITLNSSAQETAVCNIGSVNVAAHLTREGALDHGKLAKTVATAVRMLDNVIDVGFYPTEDARRASTRHRAIGLGLMGYQDVLYALGIPFASPGNLDFADRLQEFVAHAAISASADLADERGRYATFEDSLWSRGVFPQDTLDTLEDERGVPVLVDRSGQLDWSALRDRVKTSGLRNSNLMAIAPTATISAIAGCSASIEPTYANVSALSNLSGEFVDINEHLVRDLEALGIWDARFAELLKACDGDLNRITNVPEALVHKYPSVFEIDPQWLIEAAARRGKWIDQAQSLNLYLARPDGRTLHEMFVRAWRSGLKTTYYLRTLGASQVEKSTVDPAKYGKTHVRTEAPVCVVGAGGPDCEVCQ